MNRSRMTIQFSTCVLFSIFVVIVLPDLSTADIITSGDISPPYPGGFIWNISVNLTIGNNADGSIEINNGSDVSNVKGFVGYDPGSSGSVTVTGLGSFWINAEDLFVGYSGEGEMVISDQGVVRNGTGFLGEESGSIGAMPGSSGSVTVTGQGSLWENTVWLFVGSEGKGEMVISDQGVVRSVGGYIGVMPGSSGSVTVTGQGSLWDDSAWISVGHGGEGEMVISDQGVVRSSLGGDIGYISGSSGSVTVTGLNTHWQNSGALIVGYSGEGEMVISNGGLVTSSAGLIAYDPNSIGSVTVSGVGAHWINSGTLYVGGSDEGPGGTALLNISNSGIVNSDLVIIWPGGTLSGNGVLTSNAVLNYGAIKPGRSIGTLTIVGDLNIRPGSIYEVEVDNSGNSDLLSVIGNVDIGGATVQAVSTETITGSHQYRIIEATDVTIRNANDSPDTALLNVNLDYETDSVILQIEAKAFDNPSIVQTDNQSSLGRTLQQIAGGGGNSITTTLQHLENADQVRVAYDQLCGQTRPQLMPVTAADAGKSMSIVSERLNYASEGLSYYRSGSGPLLAMAEPDKISENTIMYDTSPNFSLSGGGGTTSLSEPEWGIWGKGYGVYGDRKTEDGIPGYDYTIYGIMFGMDYQITDTILLGITAGYSDGNVDFSLAGNNSDISGTHIGIYGNKNMDDWHFDSILTYSFLEYETERIVDLMGEKLKGDTDGQGISGYVEARYDWRDLDSWHLQPLASFQFSYLDLDSYTESGGVSSLGFDDQSYKSYKGSLGMKVSKEIFKRDNNLRTYIQLRGRWVHEFGDDNSSVDAHFASDPGVVFKVSDADIARDSAVLGGGFNAALNRHTRLSLGYDAQLNKDNNMHIFSTSLVYMW